MSQQINLLPAGVNQRRFSLTPASAMVCGVVASAILTSLVAAYEHSRLQDLKREAGTVDRALKQEHVAQETAVAIRKSGKAAAADERKLAELEAQLRGREEIADALKSGALGTTAGFSEYMMALSRQSMAGVWLTGFDIAAGGGEVSFSGRALHADLVPAYLQRLAEEPPLQGRRFASMIIGQPAAGALAKREKTEDSAAARPIPRFVEFTISSAPTERSDTKPGEAARPRAEAQK